MRITCPICGERPLEEFSYRGDAAYQQRPVSVDPANQNEWYEYVYVRDNPKGRHKELWRHSGGCGAWLVVERDTYTHEIFASRLAKTTRRASK